MNSGTWYTASDLANAFISISIYKKHKMLLPGKAGCIPLQSYISAPSVLLWKIIQPAEILNVLFQKTFNPLYR